jgi:soluble lytic murein transglycosylase-like protein
MVGLASSPTAQAQAVPRVVAWDTTASSAGTTMIASIPRAPALESAPSIHLRRAGQACWDEAARYHGLDPWLLYAVAYVESSHNPAAVSRPNSNGTYDIGLMQINSVHLPRLARYGVSRSTLMDACASTYVGAWIMADNIRRYGWTWEAIAAYNVGSLNTPGRIKTGRRYAAKVYAAYNKLSHQSAQR